jgi:hypothetical protein
MTWMRRMSVCLATLVLSCAGCDSSNSQIQREWVRRDGNLRRTFGFLAESEQRRPGNLEKVTRVINQQNRRDVENTLETNPRAVREWTHFEFQRWEDSQPTYKKQIDEQLRGSPEKIERTIPYIFN